MQAHRQADPFGRATEKTLRSALCAAGRANHQSNPVAHRLGPAPGPANARLDLDMHGRIHRQPGRALRSAPAGFSFSSLPDPPGCDGGGGAVENGRNRRSSMPQIRAGGRLVVLVSPSRFVPAITHRAYNLHPSCCCYISRPCSSPARFYSHVATPSKRVLLSTTITPNAQ